MMRSIQFTSTVGLALMFWGGVAARGDLIEDPPHSHQVSPEFPVVTWTDWSDDPSHSPVNLHQHQHRTAHDPREGIKIHGTGAGRARYIANKVWVGRELVRINGAHDLPTEFAHGHQGHEIDSGRYHVHTAVVGGDIDQAEADAWNGVTGPGAESIALWAFNRWEAAGTAFGQRNYPGTDNDEGTAPANGQPWHSSVSWELRQYAPGDPVGPHEVHVIYGEANTDCGAGSYLGCTWSPWGHSSGGAVRITMDDDVNWFYGTTGNPAADQYDIATLMLHEEGHVVGLGHFGANANTSYIMRERPGVLGGHTRVIDPDAAHGVQDLYAIPLVPEPATLSVLALGGLMLARRRRRGRECPGV